MAQYQTAPQLEQESGAEFFGKGPCHIPSRLLQPVLLVRSSKTGKHLHTEFRDYAPPDDLMYMRSVAETCGRINCWTKFHGALLD